MISLVACLALFSSFSSFFFAAAAAFFLDFLVVFFFLLVVFFLVLFLVPTFFLPLEVVVLLQIKNKELSYVEMQLKIIFCKYLELFFGVFLFVFRLVFLLRLWRVTEPTKAET